MSNNKENKMTPIKLSKTLSFEVIVGDKLMTYTEAEKYVASLGKGWRLPDDAELELIYENHELLKLPTSGPAIWVWGSRTPPNHRNLARIQAAGIGYQGWGWGWKDYAYTVCGVRGKPMILFCDYCADKTEGRG